MHTLTCSIIRHCIEYAFLHATYIHTKFHRPQSTTYIVCMYIGGLFSTLVDYERFCRCLLGGGVLGKVRVLSEHAVQLMTSNHLPNNGYYIFKLLIR